jgi:hypothetical protein
MTSFSIASNGARRQCKRDKVPLHKMTAFNFGDFEIEAISYSPRNDSCIGSGFLQKVERQMNKAGPRLPHPLIVIARSANLSKPLAAYSDELIASCEGMKLPIVQRRMTEVGQKVEAQTVIAREANHLDIPLVCSKLKDLAALCESHYNSRAFHEPEAPKVEAESTD